MKTSSALLFKHIIQNTDYKFKIPYNDEIECWEKVKARQ